MSEFPEWMVGRIPEYMKEGVMRWVMDGIPGGGFMMAVMENNFYEACCRADNTNRHRLWEWKECLNIIPAGCWGSPAKVEAWQRAGGMNGIERLKEPRDEADRVFSDFEERESENGEVP